MAEREAAVRDTEQSVSASATIQDFLRLVINKNGTDLHITADSPPMMRVNGELSALPFPPLSPTDTKQLCYSVITESQRHRFEEDLELDFSFGIRGLSRFRGNLFIQRGSVGAAFRLIPYTARPLAELGLPPVVAELTKIPRGLVLVTGPTGSGKSTTLAAMIDKINRERREHIVTLEDPIEFIHPHRGCIVNQREVYADTKAFKEALRHVLRQDPDVCLIGEMRDLETTESALTVAETGHLVLSTLHTNSAVLTINRIIDIFPEQQQPQIRAQLSLILQAVISQQLLPRADGRSRVLAVEVMIPNPAIRNLIRENKIHQIYSQLQVGQTKFGMQTMSQSLLDLYARKLISYEEAMGHATEPDELRSMLGPPPGSSYRR
jgi:twitching motility protein PilT